MDKDEFTRFLTVYKHYSEKKVESVELKLVADNVEQGEINVTDLQLQEGSQTTGDIPATRDILKNERFSIDESINAVNDNENIYKGDSPKKFDDMKHRFFNVMGRGFETIAIPNIFHEDYRKEILTTGLDLTLIAKNDYDFLRVATFYGDYLDDVDKTFKDESLAKNPLNKRYTREFCFKGGKVGDEIKISASGQYASVNGNRVPLGVQRFDVGQEEEYGDIKKVQYKNRQKFMALPLGATRVTIEFMKKEKDGDSIYMIDDGLGFHGVAEFTQWGWGVSKI